MTHIPFFLQGPDRPGRWLVTCDHATNTVPDSVGGGDLGLPREDMERHIAYDVGAYGVSRHLGELLDSPVLASNFSRLVIDPNRGEDDPTLLMKLYDGSVIPANRTADAAEKERRLAAFHRPYHEQYARLAREPGRVIVAMHSFTRQLRGKAPRPWEVAVLHGADLRLAAPLIAELRAQGFCVGDNEPYTGHLPGDSIDRHATADHRLNVLVEVRNDLIADESGQKEWAEILAPALDRALAQAVAAEPLSA